MSKINQNIIEVEVVKDELDLEIQTCNSDHCKYDCTTPEDNVCSAKTSNWF